MNDKKMNDRKMGKDMDFIFLSSMFLSDYLVFFRVFRVFRGYPFAVIQQNTTVKSSKNRTRRAVFANSSASRAALG